MSAAGAPDAQFYVLGGTVDPDSPSYVERRADSDLLNWLRAGELCHVLASRQMGKSSLMARAARRLATEGFQCAVVDLTIFSEKKGTPDDWYYALVDHIADKLGLDFDTGAWWEKNSLLPPLARMTKFLDKVVLEGCPGQVVVFVDEIDATIRLPFSDDFFAAIRACFNARATDPRFKRLNFVLIGVATPAQLIRDPTRTPFNVGRGIELTDFTHAEAVPLARGLHSDRERAAQLLRRVVDWTDGHPYLTQTLCWHLVRNSTWELDELVAETFLSKRAAREEPNLRLVRERLTQGGVELADVLRVYKKIVEGGIVRDEPTSPVHASLRLSGVVKTDSAGELKVRNRIYQRVFSAEWVKSELPVHSPHERTLPPDVAEAYATYDALRSLPEFRRSAIAVLARFYELRGMRDQALLIRIRALQENPSDRKRKLVQSLIAGDYDNLLASFVQEAAINAAALSPNGARVLTGSQDGTARLWSAFSSDLVLGPLRHGAAVTTVAFSPNGKWLATGSDDYTAYIWNADTGERSAPLSHEARVRYVVFSPDSRRLLTTSSDGSAGIWDVNSGSLKGMMPKHLDSIRMGAFSPDGKMVATAGQDCTAVLWPAHAGGQFGCALLHGGGVNLLGFHPTRPVLITCSEDGLLRLWDITTQELISSLAHDGPVLDFALSPDGTRIATASADRTARIWQFEPPYSQIAELHHPDTVTIIAYTPDGAYIVTASTDRMMRIWSATGAEPLSLPYRHRGNVLSLACNEDGTRVLTNDQEAARLWQVNPWRQGSPECFRHPAAICCAAFSMDGGSVAVGDAGGTVRIWRLQRGNEEPVCLRHASAVSAVAFSPDSAILASACEDGSISLWSSANELLPFSARHEKKVRVLLFSPEGDVLASAAEDGTAGLWRPHTAEPVRKFQLGAGARSLAFSYSGRLLATGSIDHSVRVWSMESGAELGLALEHPSAVTALGSDRGDVWISGSGKTVHLWRLERVWRQENSTFAFDPSILYTLRFGDLVESVSFAPSGKRFLVVTESWLHYFSLGEEGAVPITSRMLPGSWMGALRWCDVPDAIDLAFLDTGDRFRVARLWLDTPEVPPIEGDPNDLLTSWEVRLGQHVDENARIIPGL